MRKTAPGTARKRVRASTAAATAGSRAGLERDHLVDQVTVATAVLATDRDGRQSCLDDALPRLGESRGGLGFDVSQCGGPSKSGGPAP